MEIFLSDFGVPRASERSQTPARELDFMGVKKKRSNALGFVKKIDPQIAGFSMLYARARAHKKKIQKTSQNFHY